MRLISLLNYLYFANCAVQRNKDNNQDTKLPNISDKHRTEEHVGSHIFAPVLDENYTQKTTLGLESVFKKAVAFNVYYKECLMQPPVIDILFSKDDILCDGFGNLTKEAQLDLVARSKNYVLAQFHLPSLKETQAMIQLSNRQFKGSLFRMLKQVGFDPHKASEQGIRFVQDVLAKFGLSVVEQIMRYYWSSTQFHNEFLNRLFKTLASTLTDQEYLEFESLIIWVRSKHHILNKENFDQVEGIIRRHLPVVWNSRKYWRVWCSIRPLEGDSKPVPEPTRY